MCLGVPGLVIDVFADGERAKVSVGDRVIDALLVTLDDPGRPIVRGEWLLVHSGLAVERLDEASARSLLEMIETARGEAP